MIRYNVSSFVSNQEILTNQRNLQNVYLNLHLSDLEGLIQVTCVYKYVYTQVKNK